VINDRVARLLVEQIGIELGAHQKYLGISIWFERQSLLGWAKLFREQALEEARHAEKIIAYLIDNDVKFDLPALKSASTRYRSAKGAVEASLASEVAVTARFDSLATEARDAGDHRSLQFLQWFIDEQVEEERTARSLLDLIDSGINLFQAESLLKDRA
jgi:ferritin